MSFYTSKLAGPFYDPWENQPEETRASVMFERLDEYVTYARERVPYYGDRLKGYEKGAPQPLAGVPFLKSSDLRGLVPPVNKKLLAVDTDDYTVFQSGGTTGVPKTTLFTHDELDQLDLPNARGFYAVGLEPTDRVANLFAVGGLYMTFVHINRMLQQYGCKNFPFSNHTPPEFVRTVSQLFEINCFTGIASVVLNCLRRAKDLKVEKIYYGGEHIYEADKRELREKYGAKVIAAPGYGTVDSWYLGYQCSDCETGVFHAHDDQVYLEITDADTDEPCEPGKVGLLSATTFVRRLTPIVRFKVGDKAVWLDEPCSCGRTTARFKLLGRGDDVLRIGYDSIDYNFVQEMVVSVEGLLGSVQMEKQRVEGRDKLIIRVETDVEEPKRVALAVELQTKILARRPSLQEFIDKGSIWPLEVELLSPGAIERNPRTGKLRRVKDVL